MYVAVSRTRRPRAARTGDPCVGPYVVAFDQATGELAWATAAARHAGRRRLYGSPVVFDGALMVGVSGGSAELGDEADRYAFQGSMNFLDAAHGQGAARRPGRSTRPTSPTTTSRARASGPRRRSTARRRSPTSAPPTRSARGRARARERGAEVRRRPRRARRFGEIVGSYKGNVDEYIPALSSCPASTSPATPRRTTRRGSAPAATSTSTSAPRRTCSPTPTGRKLVGAGQKSGVYHVFDAETMEPVWTPDRRARRARSAASSARPPTTARRSTARSPSRATCGRSAAATARYRWVAPDRRRRALGPAGGGRQRRRLHGRPDRLPRRLRRAHRARCWPSGRWRSAARAARPSLSWGGVSVARNTVYAAVGISSLAEGFVVAFKRGGVGRRARTTWRDRDRRAAAVAAAAAAPARRPARRSWPAPERPRPPTRRR